MSILRVENYDKASYPGISQFVNGNGVVCARTLTQYESYLRTISEWFGGQPINEVRRIAIDYLPSCAVANCGYWNGWRLIGKLGQWTSKE